MKIWDIVSKAKLVFREEAMEVDSLLEEVIQAVNSRTWYSLSSQVAQIMNGMSTEDVNKWLSSPRSSNMSLESCMLPSFIANVSERTGASQDKTSILLFAARLVQHYLDSICRFTLSRCILVAGVVANADNNVKLGADEVKTALRTFLHTTSMVWLHTQLGSISNKRDTDKEGSRVAPPLLAFSPLKRQKIEESMQKSINYPPTILEYLLKDHFDKSNKILEFDNLIGQIVTIAKTHVQSILEIDGPIPHFVEDLSNKDRLSLRLLAPFVSYTIPSLENKEIIRQNEMVANCLLAEVDSLVLSKSIHEHDAKKFLKHAMALLIMRNDALPVHPDKNDFEIFFSTMRSLPDDWISSRSVTSDQYHENELLEVLIRILKCSIDKDDIKHFVKMDTLRKTLLPWVVASQEERTDPLEMMTQSISESTKDPEGLIEKSVMVLLRISNLMNHVSLIENHSTTTSNPQLKALYADLLLSATNYIIQEVKINFTTAVCELMGEYAALCSSAFRHAIIAHRWDDAFKACISNPLKDRRINNFKRLVLAMVEAGALNKLMNNIIFTVMNWQSSSSEMNIDHGKGEMIDLYELATETLAQAASERTSNVIGQPDISSSSNVNYRGCLFALHAAHDEWRRCCRTMDLYGLISQGNLLDAEGLALSKEDKKKLDETVINEIVLSSVASSQFIHLVPDKGHRFIVTGETGPYPIPPPFRVQKRRDEVSGQSASQRVIEQQKGMENQNSYDRISRLLTEHDLATRATRFMALRTLYYDALSPESLVDIIQSSDRQLIEALSCLGYFSHVIAIANCKNDEKQGCQLGGRDILADAISHMICRYMLPNTIKLLRSLPTEECDNGEELDGIEHRPTLNQLRLSSQNGSLSQGCESWRMDSRNNEVDRGSIAMSLVHFYTKTYAGSDNSLAVEVAQTLLDLDSGRAELPRWLHDFLMGKQGNTTARSFRANNAGLFSKRNNGDPIALVRLYMKSGLLCNACEVICDILMGEGNEREEEAPNRLPEKGSIDFVPYGTIDQLWNVIEVYSNSPKCNRDVKHQLLRSRSLMEKALEKHFKLMKISEMGLLSARALNPR